MGAKMSDLSKTPTATLFKQWRNQGDAASGQAMAQRFSDWYYAITTCRLGDAHGRAPLHQACLRFQQGILRVTSTAELNDWSHSLVLEEVKQAGGRISGGDFPNQFTSGRSPTELLKEVAARIQPGEARILAAAYDTGVPLAELTAEAEANGGYPVAVLRARHAVKRALRDHAGVAFTDLPDSPNLDLAPLPLYEAGRMAREAEETSFEKWMLTDMGLCKDIAEFGVFAQALRGGALRSLRVAAPVIQPLPVAEATAPAPKEAALPAKGAPIGCAYVLGLLGVFMLAASGFYLFFQDR